MSYSYTLAESITFTRTHAKHIAAKVATDLKRMQRFYQKPADKSITEYETEVIEFLKGGYLDTVTYGFRRSGNWVEPTLIYRAEDLADRSGNDDDPGRIRPGADISGAHFSSFLTYSPDWYALSEEEQNAFKSSLPFQRTDASQPGVEGYVTEDNTYSAGGKAFHRSSVRSYR